MSTYLDCGVLGGAPRTVISLSRRMKYYSLVFVIWMLGCTSSKTNLSTSCLVPKVEYAGDQCVPTTGTELSFVFRGIPVRDAVIEILTSAGVSFAVDKNLVDCSVSGSFVNIPWEETLSLVLKGCRLARLDGDNGVVRIAAADQLKSEYEPLVNLGFEMTNDGRGQKIAK